MKVGTKITLLAVCPVIIALVVSLATLLFQQRKLDGKVGESIREQAFSEAGKVAQSVYWICVSTEMRNQKRLTHNLGIARELLQQGGGISLSPETVSWQAVNQLTKQGALMTLPKMLAGSNWLGQVTTTRERAPIVDEATHVTRDFCTIFQRMNDAGDMLRVCTSVRKDDGTRALGTFIPARNPDGTDNTVVQTVLRGETYRGRAYVVNDWHTTAYEPIWDTDKKRVIGMLYIGIGMGTINKELHDGITEMVVGKTGYVFVLGAKGDERGNYLVSYKGKRDGENIWEAKDASGRPFIQSIIQKGQAVKAGASDREIYPWQNAGEAKPRTKLAAITYYEPWGWVIGAGAYEDDFAEVRGHMQHAQRNMMIWVSGVAGLVALLAAVLGFLASRGIVRPISRVISELNESSRQINAAAGHVSASSQSLAESSSEAAASLEESSASLEELASITQRNAENAQKADDLAKQTRTAADNGAADMRAMSAAMEAIKTSSDDIAKILKAIDEVAFQTNILALNAAVEAARAGEAGKGFAVVADEVRNLAQRSAQAARETAGKIEGAIHNTAQGVGLSARVAAALDDIVVKARLVDELAAEVAGASREQTQGISQINTAVGQMDEATQGNAASAEEAAASAEELNAQAEVMRHSVKELVQLIDGHDRRTGAQTGGPRQQASSHPSPPAARNGGRSAAPATGQLQSHRGTAVSGTATSHRHVEIPPVNDF